MTEAQNPLEQLAILLDADMKAVNAEILKRMQSPVELIPQLAGHLIAAGGKRIRPLLTLACARIYGGSMKRAYGLATSVEFIHSATLLHDDVIDQSDQRRGQATANTVYGNQASVLVGDFLFARSFQLMVADRDIDILRILSDAAAIIAQGEVMQLMTAGNPETTMDQYMDVIKAKTAALFAAACEVRPVIADAGTDSVRAMAEYGLNLGIAFQIADDALDYHADAEKLGKTIGDDFREGKMTAPVIIALHNADAAEREFWNRVMRADSRNEEELAQAQNILKSRNAIELSLELADSYAEKARMAMAEGPDHELRAILDNLALYAVRRSH